MTDDKKLVSFSGFLRVLAETKGWLQKVEVRLLNSNVNRNNWQYVNLEAHKDLFADTPLLVAYDGKKIGDGHNFEETKNMNDGTISPSFMSATAERIVGWIRDKSDVRIEMIDGVQWIVATAYLWKWYAKELVQKIEEQGLQGMSISIETLVDEMHKDGSVEVFTKYQILGTTILGDDVSPAVADANIRTLSALGAEEVRKMTLRVASEQRAKENTENTNKAKGEKAMLKVKDLKAKLPDHRVLSVGDGIVALMNDKYEPCFCEAREENGEVVVGDVIPVERVNFVCGESTVSVDTGKLFAQVSAALNEAVKEKEAANEAKAKAEADLEKVRKAESARRCKAVKEAVERRLAEINANREEKISVETCKDLLEDEKVKYFAEMEDADGNFCGDVEVCKEVDARCMSKILEEEKKNAEIRANANKSRFAWESAAEGTEKDDGGVLSALNRL